MPSSGETQRVGTPTLARCTAGSVSGHRGDPGLAGGVRPGLVVWRQVDLQVGASPVRSGGHIAYAKALSSLKVLTEGLGLSNDLEKELSR